MQFAFARLDTRMKADRTGGVVIFTNQPAPDKSPSLAKPRLHVRSFELLLLLLGVAFSVFS